MPRNNEIFHYIGFELAAKDQLPPGFTRVTRIGRSGYYADDIAPLVKKYDAVAADWESGAIAWVARE